VIGVRPPTPYTATWRSNSVRLCLCPEQRPERVLVRPRRAASHEVPAALDGAAHASPPGVAIILHPAVESGKYALRSNVK
jgi:hypothetical protein